MIVLLATALAQPIPELECDSADEPMDGARYLRALSLDLRGTIPTAEEYADLLDDQGLVDESVVEVWLDEEAFADQAVRYHRSLLWPNVSDIRLLSNRQRLSYDYEIGAYYRYLVAPNYRGGPISCGDFPAEWDENGELITHETPDGYIQEGWVEVAPYWNPTITVHMCAFGAQEEQISPWGTDCATYDSRYDPHCGCGPNLQWCDTFSLGHVQDDGYQAPVHRSMAKDVDLRVKRVVEQDLPYLELLTGRTAFVNGPLSHFYRFNTRTPAHVRFNELPIDPGEVPELAFTDEDTWVEIELGPEQSGILTSPAFLMKFQTRRARANRFYNAFLCQPFQPPDGGIEGIANENPPVDLQVREGCKYCHAILEPAGSHWGRWAEYGAGYLDPTEGFEPFNPECEWCALTGESCSPECARYYVTESLASEEDPYVGWLQTYEFLDARHESHVEQGPTLLVNNTVVDGRLPKCMARNVAGWLLGRETVSEEEEWLQTIADQFVVSGYQFDSLVRSVVLSDNYRRAQ